MCLIEFRGVCFIDDQPSFNICDPVAQRADWVSLDEEWHSFAVRAFNSVDCCVTVELPNHLRTTVPLKRATIALVALAPNALPTGPFNQAAPERQQIINEVRLRGPSAKPNGTGNWIGV